ncbi:formiminoglutamase protein [Stappia aggregata IAM 12614]|uniref:Formiminoglutamase protein n=1 Tax=Roseibium aggregatum (strain ATCC 25650 / DSM 13394 / JCM 20685 / NBRC 16684 / NCIMB 2208 / IAM 12614 / B1) TaxID=384765 RepID=A0NU50_ROSAI|nr:N-formylglutamate amidohydrolase [Roseibium aggregatum]EAV43452.1 formiminoglutamase protein [Stappia aggregata IAM 12614] [Roseibium aggregatum IAM 12614]
MILVEEGQSPLIVCLPHSGTDIPNAVEKRLNATGRLQADLAWRLERVFDFHGELNATVLRSSISRYVIDLDRDPKTPVSAANDPARALCPATTLDGKRIYQEGEEPGPTEIEQRSLLFYTPFHKALRHQIDRLLRSHGKVIVLDCQSMRSHIKGVTDNGLPIVSIGTAGGTSCDPDLRNVLVGSFKGLEGFTVSVDEQIKGGFITQTFGRPERGLHAMTLLLAQRSYLRHESPPFEPDKARMARLKVVLQDALTRLVDWTSISDASTGSQSQNQNQPLPVDAPAQDEAAAEEPDGAIASDEPDKAEPAAESASETPGDLAQDTVDGAPEKAEAIPVDPKSLPRVSSAQTSKVEDGPVTPLLVAE